MFKAIHISFLYFIIVSMGCSNNAEVNLWTDEKAIKYDTSTFVFANLEFEDTEEEKELALKSPFFTLTKLKRKRRFTEFTLSGDSISNSKTIRKINAMIRRIKARKDTINAIHVIFEDETPIEDFVKTYKIFTQEKPYIVVPTIEEGMYACYIGTTL